MNGSVTERVPALAGRLVEAGGDALSRVDVDLSGVADSVSTTLSDLVGSAADIAGDIDLSGAAEQVGRVGGLAGSRLAAVGATASTAARRVGRTVRRHPRPVIGALVVIAAGGVVWTVARRRQADAAPARPDLVRAA